ncbi:substrate-binding domain-containing protein [Brucella rhizosphaerae]|uniref:Periplasmic binding and sugar binding domain of LacI family protein n=1 Tax=Brucella rhizosphaerae TaxID=571254 RepID=A0A256FTV8_9HYPH|nr:substrate-binding domain-containing protein [Brucella rhizosphaerae]OYR18312.1 periplasmic binding and sugar binding domain of LacI family protein [Brucella rhizosphaerae]
MKLREFAKQLGLSATTVSRALSGYPEVAETTRMRVRDEAARLGYSPNVNAVRLVTGRAGAIGVVMGRNSEFHFAEFMRGMAERLSQDEVDILVSPIANNGTEDEIELCRRLATSRRVDAIIVTSPKPNDERIRLLSELGMPFLVHGRSKIDVPHAWLDIDNEGAVYRSTTHLLDLGHCRIAMINGRQGFTFSLDRDIGYRKALEEKGFEFDPGLVEHGDFTDEIGYRLARKLLERDLRPTAFVAGSMMTALGIYRAARSFGLTIGKDISVIAHDDVISFLSADNMVPSLTATRSSMRAAGKRCADMLMDILDGKSPADIHELWPVELILRETATRVPDTV